MEVVERGTTIVGMGVVLVTLLSSSSVWVGKMTSPPTKIKISVLMVCTGNICRSPMAEAVLVHLYTQRASLGERVDLRVESAGTDAYHVGEEADERTVEVCRRHGVPISCVARRLRPSDYTSFDYILAMDSGHLGYMTRSHRPASNDAGRHAHIALFGAYDPSLAPGAKAQSIADPYYGGKSGFERSYEQCVTYASGFLDHLERKYPST